MRQLLACLVVGALPCCSFLLCLHGYCLQEVGDKLTFVIVRPGGLKSEPATGTGVLTGVHGTEGACRGTG